MRTHVFFLFAALALSVGCKKSERREERRAFASANPPEEMIADTPSGKVKVYALRSGVFRVWFLDKAGKPVAASAAKVRLTLDTPGYPEVTLDPKDDYFQGKGPDVPSEHADATVTREVDGAAETVRVRLHMESGETSPHRDQRER